MKIFSISSIRMLLTGLLITAMSVLGSNLDAQTLTTDFTPQASYTAQAGDVLSIPANVSGNSRWVPLDADVTYTLKDGSGNTVYVYTTPNQAISTLFIGNIFLGIGSTTFGLQLPSGTTIPDGNYCVTIQANYGSLPNGDNTAVTELNGSQVGSTNMGNGSATHTMVDAFCIDYTSDDCTLSASITQHVNKFNRLRAAIVASGGSGNYSYSWTVTNTSGSSYTTANNYININCGCRTVTIVITDNVTGCEVTISQQLCAPVACAYQTPKGWRIVSGNDNNALSVSPNPAQDVLIIKVNPALEQPVATVVDITGKQVKLARLGDTSEDRMDVSDLAPGMYVVKLMDGDKLINQRKVIIQ
ncbi:MAG: T9SS type A sorting domain-containing protein [Bacteroidia bacterium]